MKKTLPLMMLLSASSVAVAQDSSSITGIDVNDSQSPYTSVCVAATESWANLDAAIEDNGFTPIDIKEIYCNDKQLMRFARENLRKNVWVPEKLVVKKTDDSTETNICLTALQGEPLDLGSGAFYTINTLRCNGLEISSFVSRYKNHDIVEVL